MRINDERKTLLVENPLTGNNSFARAMKMQPFFGLSPWATPDECRKEVDGWEKYKKFILVRDVRARFEAGATLAFSKPDEFAGSLREVVDALPVDAPPTQRGAAVLKFLAEGGEAPEYMRPQSLWLKACFDEVIATYTIAEYFNFHNIYGVRNNRIVRTADSVDVFAPSDASLLRVIYADDFKLFDKLLVWSPEPDKVRLVSGYCATCQKKKESGWAGIDLTHKPEITYKNKETLDTVLGLGKKTKRRKKSSLDKKGYGG